MIFSYNEETKDEVIGGMPDSKGASSQNNYSNGHIYRGQSLSESNTSLEGYREWYNDDGSAARYFYNAKETERDNEYIPYEVRPMENQDNQQKLHLYSEGKNYKLYQGNMLEMLDVIFPNSIDAIVTDPPYELGFMGKCWDNSGVAFQESTWEKCFQVLKPGGYLLAFGGSRTFHRIACAIEDAGFEIRDTIMWLYGSGFPKSMNIGLAIDKKNGVDNRTGNIVSGMATNNILSMRNGISESMEFSNEYEERKAQNEWAGWGTALKPAYEPVVIARKPCEGSCVDNVLKYGVGGVNIDECRIGDEERTYKGSGASPNKIINHEHGDTGIGMLNGSGKDNEYTVNGRYPANVVLTYDETDKDEVCGGMPESGSGNNGTPYNYAGREYTNKDSSMFNGDKPQAPSNYNDNGSAARYFYCAKASKRDRDEGLEQFETKTKVFNGKSDTSSKDVKDVEQRFTTQGKNIHPTVKPTDLMQYLIRLVTPKGGTVLDPFNGSGSTGKAIMWENRDRNANYNYIGIELGAEYLAISEARIQYATNVVETSPKVSESMQKMIKNQMNLFELPE